MSELKACPSCGGEAKVKIGISKYFWFPFRFKWYTPICHYIQCLRCRVRTKNYKTAEVAAHFWNRRQEVTDLPMNEMCYGCMQLQDNCECRIVERECRQEVTDDTK